MGDFYMFHNTNTDDLAILDREQTEYITQLQEQRPSLYNLPEEITSYIMSFTNEAQKIRELESKIAEHVNNMIAGAVQKATTQRWTPANDNARLKEAKAIRRLALLEGQELPYAIDRWEYVYDALRRRTPFG